VDPLASVFEALDAALMPVVLPLAMTAPGCGW
jgi:hypothetical protein